MLDHFTYHFTSTCLLHFVSCHFQLSHFPFFVHCQFSDFSIFSSAIEFRKSLIPIIKNERKAGKSKSNLSYFYSLGRYINTENAYIKAPIVSIQSEISGIIDKVYIKNNQKISKGEKLFKIDVAKLNLGSIDTKILFSIFRCQYQKVLLLLKIY